MQSRGSFNPAIDAMRSIRFCMMQTGLREAVALQGRVLLALMLREARTRYGRQRAGYLWALIEPLLHISAFYLAFSYRVPIIPLGDSLFVFLATGFGVFLGFRDTLGRTQGGYQSNQSLLAYPVVRLMDVFLGRALLELATWLAVLGIIFGGMLLLGYGYIPHNILKMLAAIAALFAIAFGIGLTLGILSEFVPSVDNIMRAPMMLLYFCSGLFFVPDMLPPALRNVVYWNPVLHALTLFREGYYPGYESHLLDLRYLAGWALGSLVVALVVEKIARKPIRNLAV
jgi:capsular polysaccharide transport system permease protein